MNGEPPQGDDLQRMLVAMKQNVLERATPRPRRRARRTGIAIGVVSVLLLGLAGGGVALGLIPTSVTADPGPSATTAPESGPSAPETPSGAPVVDEPTPTPTATSTRAPYSAADPATWTISGDEVGPIAIGGPVDGELDDLGAAYTRETDDACPSPDVTFWHADGYAPLTVTAADGRVAGVAIGLGSPLETLRGPTTPEGMGVGSTLSDLRAAYPDLTRLDAAVAGDQQEWTIVRNGEHVTFQTGADPDVVAIVWVSSVAAVPYEFCG